MVQSLPMDGYPSDVQVGVTTVKTTDSARQNSTLNLLAASTWNALAKAVEMAPRNDAGEPVVSAAHIRRVAAESVAQVPRDQGRRSEIMRAWWSSREDGTRLPSGSHVSTCNSGLQM